jgi:hypothetical protein
MRCWSEDGCEPTEKAQEAKNTNSAPAAMISVPLSLDMLAFQDGETRFVDTIERNLWSD